MIVGQKLVRDKIADFPYALPDRHTVEFDKLSPGSIPGALVDKIIEEAGELGRTLLLQDDEQFIEEAGDVLEAFNELLIQKRISFDDVNKARLKKKRLKGGFEKGIWRTERKEDER